MAAPARMMQIICDRVIIKNKYKMHGRKLSKQAVSLKLRSIDLYIHRYFRIVIMQLERKIILKINWEKL